MRESQTLAVLGLVLLHVVLAVTVVVLETADVAWAPSYFAGDDGDTTTLPLSERLPALAGAPGGMMPILAALATVAARPPAGPRRIAPAGIRFRAPPLA